MGRRSKKSARTSKKTNRRSRQFRGSQEGATKGATKGAAEGAAEGAADVSGAASFDFASLITSLNEPEVGTLLEQVKEKVIPDEGPLPQELQDEKGLAMKYALSLVRSILKNLSEADAPNEHNVQIYINILRQLSIVNGFSYSIRQLGIGSETEPPADE